MIIVLISYFFMEYNFEPHSFIRVVSLYLTAICVLMLI